MTISPQMWYQSIAQNALHERRVIICQMNALGYQLVPHLWRYGHYTVICGGGRHGLYGVRNMSDIEKYRCLLKVFLA
jgi:hypothetical protein